jgi:ABC-2 type transport system ATP-binding protein
MHKNTTDPILGELVRLRPGAGHPAQLGPDAIVVEDLAKTYANGTEAVRGVTIRVAAGECYGLLGPNGAGKSTTLGMLGTLVRPTSGRASVAGFDVVAEPREVRRRIGFAMQEVGVDPLATALELLVLQGRLHGLARAESERRARLLLAMVDLAEVAGKRLAELSGGMQRRVDLAASLMHLPTVVFLDEPTEGLDPRARAAIWDALDRLRQQLGLTVVLTTHYMPEADRLCDRLGIVDRGSLVVEGTPAALKASVGSDSLEDVYLRYTERAFEPGERVLELAA